MLKSVLFLLVMICLLTTPTRAYEAYNNSSLFVLRDILLKQTEGQELNNLLLLTDENVQQTPVIDKTDVCGTAALKAEKDNHIKPNLLQTIALVESGRFDKNAGHKVAWPWTVQANGHGHYYKTKEEAVAKVYELQAQGVTNIDVGCMQINLKYHGHAFNSVEEAMDPQKNVAYSAKFLLSLYMKNGKNWQKTAMQYHSKNHTKGLNYKFRLEKQYAQYINAYDKNQTLF